MFRTGEKTSLGVSVSICIGKGKYTKLLLIVNLSHYNPTKIFAALEIGEFLKYNTRVNYGC